MSIPPRPVSDQPTPRRKHSEVRRRKAQIAFRLTDGEKAAVLAYAEHYGQTVGQVMRCSLRDAGVIF